jgi:hypothetical protein
MTTTVLVLGLALFAADADSKPRKPSGIAPSLPALTKEEEAKIEDVIDRFIRADIGRLKGAAARKAIADLEALKAEAIPALIRGLNRAARMNATCPVLTIHKKLSRLLLASNDQVLLEYARDEIGADVGTSKYTATLRDLRVRIALRKNALARLGPAKPPVPRGVASLRTPELAKAASTERGARLTAIVQELGKRSGKEALSGLAVAAGSYDRDVQKLARTSLDTVLGRLSSTDLGEQLQNDSAEVRKSAVRVAAARHTSLLGKVIDRLNDESAEVRAEARAALKKASKTEDFGPAADATPAQRRQAQQKWRAWWERSRK